MYYRYEEAITIYERRTGHRPSIREIACGAKISSATLNKIAKNEPVATRSIEKLAKWLGVSISRMYKDNTAPTYYADEL